MASFTALYDACVLYPAPVRDLLIRLAMCDLFQARWSETIHEEWMSNLQEDRPDITPENLQKTKELMDLHVKGSLVTGYEDLIPGLSLPDENDRHVLAAAIRGKADVIVTFNLKDFPEETLKQYGIEAQHPDEFITHLIDLSRERVLSTARRQRMALKNPPVDPQEFLSTLERQGLPISVSSLRAYLDWLE